MIHIDGSLGEGGGQVLRSSLTLSILTGQPVHLINIRARRPKPGLQAQHLTAVSTAAAICSAEVTGAAIGSEELIFVPGPVQPGSYRADIGTAGSTSLVLQTVFLPLALGSPGSTDQGSRRNQHSPVEIILTGGTHVPWSPSIHYLTMQWLPMLRRLGFNAEIELLLAGFYPEGSGQVRATIRPVERVAPLRLPERGALRSIRGISAVANLDMSIAERQRNRALTRLKGRHSKIEIELLDLPARNKGTFLLLLAEFKHSSACYVSLGAPGKRAEQVADEACLWLERFLESTGAVDEHLADQLLLPLAFAEGESLFRTARVTEHLRTNAQVIRAFGAAEIEIGKEGGGVGLVRVRPG